MSYSIIVYNKKGGMEEIPFSTNKNFEDNWIPIIEKLNLFLINEFQYGINIGYEELNELLNELKIVKSYPSTPENLIDRIDYLEKRLSILRDRKNFSNIFLG